MIGFKFKRALIDLLLVESRSNGLSPFFGKQVSYTVPRAMEETTVYGGDGIGPRTLRTAEGNVGAHQITVDFVIRVALDPGEERETDALAETLGLALTALVESNRNAAGPLTNAHVSGWEWSNPSDDDQAVTELRVSVLVEGYP